MGDLVQMSVLTQLLGLVVPGDPCGGLCCPRATPEALLVSAGPAVLFLLLSGFLVQEC